MSDKDMVTVYERRDGSKPELWRVYWCLAWDVFSSFWLAVGLMSRNYMTIIVQSFCLLCFIGFTIWHLNHLTWNVEEYTVKVSRDKAKETVNELA